MRGIKKRLAELEWRAKRTDELLSALFNSNGIHAGKETLDAAAHSTGKLIHKEIPKMDSKEMPDTPLH